jgi:hypothetical protein
VADPRAARVGSLARWLDWVRQPRWKGYWPPKFEWRKKGYAEEAIDDFLSGSDESGQPRDRRGPS